ncbi:MAG: nucleotidyl transferase AbiEii/AbiGii toxin family protein [Thermoanaerobaculales bacterium]|nr:nucleotidyl transferase AbiEii/AbiGii toxin family protein [Thermoanaerobaculales bacterium]
MSGLDSFQREVLAAFFERQDGFFLTGGAALAGFYLHHRTTQDLDLFTTEEVLDEGEGTLAAIARDHGAEMERLRSFSGFRRFLLTRGAESLIVDLVHDSAPQIDTEKTEIEGIRIDSAREIMANKLCTLLSRAELRDIVDVRALEATGLKVEDHLPFAAAKDAGLTPGQLAWVLSEIEIGEDASPPGGVTAEEIRVYLDGLIERLTSMAYPN